MDDFESDISSEEEEEQEMPVLKRKANPFIEEEAAVDDDDDEDEDDDDDEEAADQGEIDEVQQQLDEARHRDFDRREREREDIDAEQLAQELKERYAKRSVGQYRGDSERVPQRVLIPSVDDSKLWMLKCKPGKEKDIVILLLRKFFDLRDKPGALEILSAFTRDGHNGYIYVEANRQLHVQQAIEKVTGIYAQTIKLVPVNEMVDCLTIKKRDVDLKIGGWVRIKKGRKYDGDLAQILEVGDGAEFIKIKIIPRIEYALTEKRKKSLQRPVQKFFSPDNVLDKKLLTSQRGGYYLYDKETFDKNGYMEKEVKLTSLQTEGVNPSLEEITMFSGSNISDGREIAALVEANVYTVNDFQVGENVEVVSGELTGLKGIVNGVDNDLVTVKTDSNGLVRSLQFPAQQLRKWFSEGGHVKVVNGVHKDETGMILNILDMVATILSDSSMTPFKCFIRDIISSTDVNAGGTNTTGSRYEVYDLLLISPNEVGLVTRIEKDLLILLNQHGATIRHRPTFALKKLENSLAATTDSTGEPVQANDLVSIVDPLRLDSVKRGTVLHIWRNFVFVRSREVIENSGIIVNKNISVSVLGGKKATGRGFVAPLPRGNFSGRGGRGGGFSGGRDPLLSKTVVIVGGPYKGYVGIVKDFSNDNARVELHSTNKTITIDRSKLQLPGQTTAPRNVYASAGRDRSGAYDGGNRTPAWNNSGSKTPAWDAGGGKTPAWDSGSKTPAWDSGSKTPGWDGASGGKTPAWSAEYSGSSDYDSRNTPADWEGGYSSALADTSKIDTPQYNSAATPSYSSTPADYSSTPGYHHAATPGYPGQSAATPYNHPTTPFDPSTPAATTYRQAPLSRTSPSILNWNLVDVEVYVIPDGSFRNGMYDNQKGVIEQPGSEATRIFLIETNQSISIPTSCLFPVTPEKRDLVKITGGDMISGIGTLLTKDETDGVVKIRGQEKEPRVVSLSFLAKYSHID